MMAYASIQIFQIKINVWKHMQRSSCTMYFRKYYQDVEEGRLQFGSISPLFVLGLICVRYQLLPHIQTNIFINSPRYWNLTSNSKKNSRDYAPIFRNITRNQQLPFSETGPEKMIFLSFIFSLCKFDQLPHTVLWIILDHSLTHTKLHFCNNKKELLSHNHMYTTGNLLSGLPCYSRCHHFLKAAIWV